MSREEIKNSIQDILIEVTENEEINLNEQSSPATVDDWDSLAHFTLVMELQNQYGVKFSAQEIQNWKNVGNIIDSILSVKS